VTIFPFKLGGRIALFVKASGDASVVNAFSARIRRLNFDRSDFLDDAPSVLMQTQFVAASGAQSAGWHVWLDVAGPVFREGYFGIDIWPVVGGAPMNTKMAVVLLRKSA
jgi:hypothetical protein